MGTEPSEQVVLGSLSPGENNPLFWPKTLTEGVSAGSQG